MYWQKSSTAFAAIPRSLKTSKIGLVLHQRKSGFASHTRTDSEHHRCYGFSSWFVIAGEVRLYLYEVALTNCQRCINLQRLIKLLNIALWAFTLGSCIRCYQNISLKHVAKKSLIKFILEMDLAFAWYGNIQVDQLIHCWVIRWVKMDLLEAW